MIMRFVCSHGKSVTQCWNLLGESHLNSDPSQILEVTFVHILKQLISSTCQAITTQHKITYV